MVRAPDGTPVLGPPALEWKGRNKPHRQHRRWATVWSPEQIAEDFGISKSALAVWLQKAERDELRVVGGSSGRTADDVALLREALKRNRLLEQEAEVMQRMVACLSQAALPK